MSLLWLTRLVTCVKFMSLVSLIQLTGLVTCLTLASPVSLIQLTGLVTCLTVSLLRLLLLTGRSIICKKVVMATVHARLKVQALFTKYEKLST